MKGSISDILTNLDVLQSKLVNGPTRSFHMPPTSRKNRGSIVMAVSTSCMAMTSQPTPTAEIAMKASRKQVDFLYVKGRRELVRQVLAHSINLTFPDLVGRMLLCTRNHLIPSSSSIFAEPKTVEMLTNYSSPPAGSGPGTPVYRYQNNTLNPLVLGVSPKPGQKIIYVDGTFDLFTPGHVELLRLIFASADSPYVVVGIHEDYTINKIKGYNYPIMNILERTLVVLQCKYVSALVISAPYTPSKVYLTTDLGVLAPAEVWHGPTKVIEADGEGNPYADAKELGLLRSIDSHRWDDISASKIVDRILKRRLDFEERQRKKGVKAVLEEELKITENLEDNPWA